MTPTYGTPQPGLLQKQFELYDIMKKGPSYLISTNLAQSVISVCMKWPFRPSKKIKNTMPKTKISKDKHKVYYKSKQNPVKSLETFSCLKIIGKQKVVN